MNPEVFAVTGGLFCGLSMWPQFEKIQKTKSVESFCPKAIVLRLFGAFFFMYYAFIKKLPVIFFGTLIGLLFDIYIFRKISKPMQMSEPQK